MSDNTPESNKDSGSDTSSETKSFSEKYSDVMGKVNETLGNVDWTQMGKYGKEAGIIAVVVIAQIIIKIQIFSLLNLSYYCDLLIFVLELDNNVKFL